MKANLVGHHDLESSRFVIFPAESSSKYPTQGRKTVHDKEQ